MVLVLCLLRSGRLRALAALAARGYPADTVFVTGHYARLRCPATGRFLDLELAEQADPPMTPPTSSPSPSSSSAADGGAVGGLAGEVAEAALGRPGPSLARAADLTKDQSYFMAAEAGPDCWANVVFPLGGWTKDRV